MRAFAGIVLFLLAAGATLLISLFERVGHLIGELTGFDMGVHHLSLANSSG